jgi:arylsulfatase A-like enzyme
MKPKNRTARYYGTPQKNIVPLAITAVSLVLVTGIAFIAIRNRAPSCKNCNVVLVSLDTLSAKHLPCYGYDKNTAPNLCRIAKENAYFSRAYTQSYYTLPSHMSMFTGQYPSTHGILDPGITSLSTTSRTLTETLDAQGYRTLYFGPTDNNFFPLSRGLGRGFDYIDDEYNYLRVGELQNWKKGVSMLKDNTAKGVPTFLFLHTYYTHEPYLPDTRNNHFTDTVDLDIPVTAEEYTAITPAYIQFVKDYFRQSPAEKTLQDAAYQKFLNTEDFGQAKTLYQYMMTENCRVYCLQAEYYYVQNKDNPRHIAYIRSMYDEMIFNLDKEIGKLVAGLEPLLQKNTILVITSDHGEAFMEHRNIMHQSLYGEVLEVPLIVIAPGIHRGSIDTPASIIDIYPTILGLLQLPQVASVEGRDLSWSFSGFPRLPNYKPIISERYAMVYDNGQHKAILQRSIISGHWKLLVTIDQQSTRDTELYNMTKDPYEKRDISSEEPDVVRMLLRIHQQFADNHPQKTYPSQSEPTNITPEESPRLFHY